MADEAKPKIKAAEKKLSLKKRYENSPVTIALGALTLVGGLIATGRAIISSSSSKSFQNKGDVYSADGSMTINQGRADKDANTPDGAREALQRQNKTFDAEAFSESVREGDVQQAKLYLIGGKSPNDLYNGGVPLLVLTLNDTPDRFPEMLDLFVHWKAAPLNFAKQQPRISYFAGWEADTIPDQQSALFSNLANRAERPGQAEQMKSFAQLLKKAGASPNELINAIQAGDEKMDRETSNALKQGIDLVANDRAAGVKTPSDMHALNKATIGFLKSL